MPKGHWKCMGNISPWKVAFFTVYLQSVVHSDLRIPFYFDPKDIVYCRNLHFSHHYVIQLFNADATIHINLKFSFWSWKFRKNTLRKKPIKAEFRYTKSPLMQNWVSKLGLPPDFQTFLRLCFPRLCWPHASFTDRILICRCESGEFVVVRILVEAVSWGCWSY